MLDERCDVAADPQIAVEERPLGADRAGADSLGRLRVGDDRDVGVVTRGSNQLGRPAGDADGPGFAVDDALLDREGEIGGGYDGCGRGRHRFEPVVGEELAHMARLRRRALASAVVGPERRPPAKLGQRLGARVLDVVTLTWLLFFVLVEIDQRLLGGDPWGQQPLQIDMTEPRALMLGPPDSGPRDSRRG